MTSKTTLLDVVVIRKTRISENDLVFCMVANDSRIINAIGKSARKPGNTFSNRLDLFNVAHISLASTRGLGIIREATLIETHKNIHNNFSLMTCASAISELVWRLTFSENTNEALFDFLIKTFFLIDTKCEKSKEIALAALIKLLAMEGFGPAYKFCSLCGRPLQKATSSNNFVTFSPDSGGFLCDECAKTDLSSIKKIAFKDSILSNFNNLLNLTYEQIIDLNSISEKDIFDLKKLLQLWIERVTSHKNNSLELL
jgi:DNA repair protein RecO